jgi:molybdenum cofactor guanylyltransferase
MNKQNKVTGVVLAGGLARRMHNQDKGLVQFRGQPLVSYALQAMTAVSDEVLINANRNIEQYSQFGFPVITDDTDSFDGPLAGVLAAMRVAQYPEIVVMPCDSPMLEASHLKRLLSGLHQNNIEVSVAFDGERIHPVFLALKTTLFDSLKAYLQQGERKIDRWLAQHKMIEVDFSDQPEIFLNINTLHELDQLQG